MNKENTHSADKFLLVTKGLMFTIKVYLRIVKPKGFLSKGQVRKKILFWFPRHQFLLLCAQVVDPLETAF